MAGPFENIVDISPSAGPACGGDVVRLLAEGYSPDPLWTRIGEASAEVIGSIEEGGFTYIDILTPQHEPGTVDVCIGALDDTGSPIPGVEVALPNGYTYCREQIVDESSLTRLVRTLLRLLKQQVLENTNISVSIDYDDTAADGLSIVAMSKLPSLVLSGPRMSENRFYSTNVHRHEKRPGPGASEVISFKPPYTVDLEFTITGASDRTVELLNMMAATATVLHRNRWIEMPRDPNDPLSEKVRWEMDPRGEFRTRLDGPDDVRAFSCGLVIRGFDLAQGMPASIGQPIDDLAIDTALMDTKGN